ncbi:MAG: hypothetical protein Q8936_02735 [Bacillota bacterium]|nr:hypothetical protein [Bacillota bacterium]
MDKFIETNDIIKIKQHLLKGHTTLVAVDNIIFFSTFNDECDLVTTRFFDPKCTAKQYFTVPLEDAVDEINEFIISGTVKSYLYTGTLFTNDNLETILKEYAFYASKASEFKHDDKVKESEEDLVSAVIMNNSLLESIENAASDIINENFVSSL